MSNILPKKRYFKFSLQKIKFIFLFSWNVYNEMNKEKVRKDELEAQTEIDKKAEQADTAERESRLNLLRKRANIDIQSIPEELSNPYEAKIERFTLFDEVRKKLVARRKQFF